MPKRTRKNETNTIAEPILLDLSFEDETNTELTNKGTNDEEMDIGIKSLFEQHESEIIITEKVRKKRNKFDWRIQEKFDDLNKALDFLEEQGFTCFDYSDLKMGQKFYFRCKKIPKERSTWCSKRYTLFLPADKLEIQLLSNGLEHDHEKLLEGTVRPPSDEMKEFIVGLFKCGTTKIADVNRHVNYARDTNGLFKTEQNPANRQIEYMLRKFRDAQTPRMVKVGDLMTWCEKNKEIPSDENQGFVIGSESSGIQKDLSFRFVLSTLFLLNLLKSQKKICIDATYKLNWLGFPLMVLGTIDRAKRFHPLIYACCSHEKGLDFEFIFKSVKNAIKTHFNYDFEPEMMIADGADAIRNAFYNSFASAKHDVMCYVHVLRNCSKQPFASKSNKSLIFEDIRKMHLAPNKPTFNMMSKLFCEKWIELEPNFVAYFRKEWLNAHCNWYEGYSHYTPSTNNALESHNAVIKRKITLRRRLPMNEFLKCMMEMTTDASKQLTNGVVKFATEPDVTKKIYEAAALMVQETFKAFRAKSSNANTAIFSIPSSECASENATEAYYKTLVAAKWKSFDEFIIHGFQKFYITIISFDDWKTKSECTCAQFFKHYMCKHVVAAGHRLKLIEFPEEANPVLLAPTRRKPGRAKAATKALQMQQ